MFSPAMDDGGGPGGGAIIIGIGPEEYVAGEEVATDATESDGGRANGPISGIISGIAGSIVVGGTSVEIIARCISYANRKGHCFREQGLLFFSQRATEGTIGTIGTPSSLYHSGGPLYDGIATMITEGRSVRGCCSGVTILHVRIRTDHAHSSICEILTIKNGPLKGVPSPPCSFRRE
jgi:hypothetical protein